MKQDADHGTDTRGRLTWTTAMCACSQVTGGIKTGPQACSTKTYDIQPCAGVLYKPYTSPNFSRSHCRNSIELEENFEIGE